MVTSKRTRVHAGRVLSYCRPEFKECRNSSINPANAFGKAEAQQQKGGTR